MWLVAINPTAGHGQGAIFAERVTKFLIAASLEYQVFSASNASELKKDLESFLE
jgi:diacylglycerol kinase (ATP)